MTWAAVTRRRRPLGRLICQFPAARRTQVLRPGHINKVLVVQWLKVEHADEATSFILNQPNIDFLGIGGIYLSKRDKGKDTKDGDVEKSEDENEKKDEHDPAAIVVPTTSPEHVVRLDKLRHLCLFSGSGGLAWSHVVPSLAKGSLTELKTLIVECHDRDAFAKLIAAAAPALRSVAVSFQGPGIDIDLSKARSLSNLATTLALYPDKEHILADTIATVSSAPPSLANLFVSIGPSTIQAEKEPDSAPSQWAAFDALLAGLPRLRRIVVVVVFDPCISMFIAMPGQGGSMLEKWKGDALEYVKARLSVCGARGIVEVKHVVGSWTSGAFANHPLPE
ncbi:hypothetical protein LZ30DRAFT_406404 [Colletotrichum cereale]|nr:hypothetical protein LZ30DRAFT_406404 [Colletotrichum cereale]